MRVNIVKIEWNCKAADADGRKLSGVRTVRRRKRSPVRMKRSCREMKREGCEERGERGSWGHALKQNAKCKRRRQRIVKCL